MTPDNPEVTMVERVARLFCEGDADTLLPIGPYFERTQPQWKFRVPAARAVIQAMRKPTEVMIENGDRRNYGNEMLSDELERAHIPRIWQAMIDAALSEGVKGGGE
jgi:hypothetical protein